MEPGDRAIASEWSRKGDSVDHHGFQFPLETFPFDPDDLDYFDLESHLLSGAMVFSPQVAEPMLCDYTYVGHEPLALFPLSITRPPLPEPPMPQPKRFFQCPIYQADLLHSRTPSCNGVKAENMAAVRRHLKRSNNIRFIKLCPACNEDIIDELEFETLHGNNGEFCSSNQQQQRRGKAAEEQWNALYRKLSPSSTEIPSPYVGQPAPIRSSSWSASQQDYSDGAIASHAPEHGYGYSNTLASDNTVPDKPYQTPYELIFSDQLEDATHSPSMSSTGPTEFLDVPTAFQRDDSAEQSTAPEPGRN